MVADLLGEPYASLAQYLVQVVGSRVNALLVVIDDACQVAWARLVAHAGRVDEDAVMSWLVTTAIRVAIKLARRDQRELSLEARIDKDGELNIASPLPEPHDQARCRERLAEVRRLPVRQQLFLWLIAAGCSYHEIAGQEAGLTARTVERQI